MRRLERTLGIGGLSTSDYARHWIEDEVVNQY